MTHRPRKRLILLGIAGLDWAGFDDASARGLVPGLTRLAGRSAIGPLHGIDNEGGVTPWATMASGQSALVHGVLRETEGWAGGVRPAGRSSWRAAPVWVGLAKAGISTGSVAWPASRPGDDWAGMHIDDSLPVASGNSWDEWALPPHCAPAELREALRERRIHPTDITTEQLLPLVPDIASVDQSRESGLALLAIAMARAATIQDAAALLLDRGGDALFIHHSWLGDVRSRAVSRPPWDRLVDGAWRFLDGLVGHLVALAGEGATVLVAGGGMGRAPGVLLAAGPGIVPGSRIEGATLLDIAPTVLAQFGLHDVDLPGQVLVGPTGTVAVPPPDALPPAAGRAELERVVALGYAPPPGPPPRWRADGWITTARLLLPIDPARAEAAAAAALALVPDDPDALSLRAAAHVAQGVSEPLAEIGDALLRLAPDQPWGAIVHGARHAMAGDAAAARPWLAAAQAAGDPETTLRVGGAWLLLDRPTEARAAFSAVLAAQPHRAEAAVGLSVAALAMHRLYDAEQPLRQLLAVDPGQEPAWRQLAAVLTRGGRSAEAAGAMARADRLAAHGTRSAARA